jgi:hypothetical protein
VYCSISVDMIADIKGCIVDNKFIELCRDGNALDDIVQNYVHGFEIKRGVVVRGCMVTLTLPSDVIVKMPVVRPITLCVARLLSSCPHTRSSTGRRPWFVVRDR